MGGFLRLWCKPLLAEPDIYHMLGDDASPKTSATLPRMHTGLPAEQPIIFSGTFAYIANIMATLVPQWISSFEAMIQHVNLTLQTCILEKPLMHVCIDFLILTTMHEGHMGRIPLAEVAYSLMETC